MPEPTLIPFSQAIADTEGQDRTLLLGNGFSIQYFDYRSLLEASEIEDGTPLKELFTRLETTDFELVMRYLDDAAFVEKAYGNLEQAETFRRDAETLREGLIHAIESIHPNVRTELNPVIPSAFSFINNFKRIYTLNYDLLLYWVRLEDIDKYRDGFGLGESSGDLQGPFYTNAYCDIYNLHGGLHLFQTGWDTVHKRTASANTIISNISDTIRNNKKLPLYVAEGTSDQKMAKINSVPYLKHCLDTLRDRAGNLFVYGHSASPNDEHIYHAIFESQVERLYFCIHSPTASINEINGELQRYKARFPAARDIQIVFVDAESAHVWDAAIEGEEGNG